MSAWWVGSFLTLAHIWVVDVYAHTFHRAIRSTPYEKWQDGCRKHMLRLPGSEEGVVMLLAKTKSCTIQHDGVHAFGNVYTSPDLAPLLPRRKGRGRPGFFKFDPADLIVLRVVDEERGVTVKVYVKDQEYARGLSEGQHRRVRAAHFEETGKCNASSRDLHATRVKMLEREFDAAARRRKSSAG